MNVLGISALDKESTATIVRDGRIVAAISEERLTRVKQQGGFPSRSVDAALSIAGLAPADVHIVAYPFFRWPKELGLVGRAALGSLSGWRGKVRQRGVGRMTRHTMRLAHVVAWELPRKLARADGALAEGLARLQLADRLRRYDHQYTHAVSAYYTSGLDRALVVTADWYGSGKAGAVYVGESGRLKLLATVPFPNSLGVLYASVTGSMGFTPDRHEGKVVGLAAYGDPSRLTPHVMARFAERADGYEFLDPMDPGDIAALTRTHSREDVAAAHQQVVERVLLRSVEHYLRVTGCTSIAAAGGLFANVKLNQKILELRAVDALFVHPAMSDMGTGTGAAMAAALDEGDLTRPEPLGSVFLGPEYDADAVEQALASAGLRYRREADIASAVARLIAERRIVGRFTGRMEYGPRALGNRSILANTSDPGVTDVLNRKLHRNDFMPFAPATLAEAADICYINSSKVRHAAQFMTVCLRCTSEMQRMSPAAVHVDGTARPQLVEELTNPDLHRILREVRRLTGSPSIMNTSFNVHEDPIVCSPADAVGTFIAAELDALAIGDFLVTR